MDIRRSLMPGTCLPFPGMFCTVREEIGRGSNAIVYKGDYPDLLNENETHTVLIKELFPLDAKGAIHRDDEGNVVCEESGLETWKLHRRSFEHGNHVHLRMLRQYPDLAGANLNTFTLHGTLYTVLGYTGGRSLGQELTAPETDLRRLTVRLLKLLDALDAFHGAGYLHLDVAPDNILLIGADIRERVLLIDYNSVHDRRAVSEEPTEAFSVKAGYTAPELRTGHTAAISEAADLYSVTAVFYRCLAGSALTPFQMIRPTPPDVSGCAALQDVPDTVCAMVRQILLWGLQTLPERRYRSVSEMRQAVQELLDRIDGVGVTHWALWETGRKNVQKAIRDNPSFAYIRDEDAIFPANAIRDDGSAFPVQDYIREMLEPDGRHTLLAASGGMGKTTSLLRAVYLQSARYSASRSAVAYIPLIGRRADGASFILDRVLENLRFREHTRSFDDARHCLRQLLDQPLKTRDGEKPVLLILLDGLNEVAGSTEGLLAEINELSRLRGVRILLTTRSDEPSLPFARLTLAPMTEDDVHQLLSRRGLLMPESPELQKLLQTPLMLSIFLRSAMAEEKQLSVRTQEELMAVYFDSIRDKAIRELPEDADERWKIDAAISYVLPAIAGELQKKQVMRDTELLRVVERCYRLFSSRLLRRAFPQWIGHSAAIRGAAANAEEWYGQIVHDLLWKRLGLLMRTEQGGYQIPHQMILEYLTALDGENAGKIRKRRRIQYGIISGALVLALAAGYDTYAHYIRPQPYDDAYAEAALTSALGGYIDASNQYAAIRKLVDCSLTEPEYYAQCLMLYDFEARLGQQGLRNYAPDVLELALSSGSVVSWSGEPLDKTHYEQLVELARSRDEEYALYVDVLTYVMEDEWANGMYAATYPQLLSKLIEADADITAKLYQLVCEVHETGRFADDSPQAEAYRSTEALAIEQNKHMTADLAAAKLSNLESARESALRSLNACAAIQQYQRGTQK